MNSPGSFAVVFVPQATGSVEAGLVIPLLAFVTAMFLAAVA